jgi:hypothetical protein
MVYVGNSGIREFGKDSMGTSSISLAARRLMGLGALMTALAVAACSGADGAANDTASGSAAAPGDPQSARVAASDGTATAATADTIEVWKDPNCGCCKNWIEHMRKHGFTVIAHDTEDMTPVKQAHGIGADLVSCHTGMIHGYAIEGHVPADLVRKMLNEKPKIAGLAVPGMPMGSPGLEGGMKDKYDVIAFTSDGQRSVYASR